MNAAELFCNKFWEEHSHHSGCLNFTQMAEMCQAFAANETAAKEAAEQENKTWIETVHVYAEKLAAAEHVLKLSIESNKDFAKKLRAAAAERDRAWMREVAMIDALQDKYVLIEVADYLNALGGGPMEDRLRLLHSEIESALSPIPVPAPTKENQ